MKDDVFIRVVLVMACFILALMMLLLGCHLGVVEERAAAVKAGVARWDVDPKTGVTRFVYGVSPQKP